MNNMNNMNKQTSCSKSAPQCSARILREGWDGKLCYVHARIASDGGERMLITAQKMNVAGSDCFFPIRSMCSTDGGQTWDGFSENGHFHSVYYGGIRSVCCDMTPMYHRRAERFIATGHIAQYSGGSIFPVNASVRRRSLPYSVYDFDRRVFGEVKYLEMPGDGRFADCGSGCSQCVELPDGSVLVPVSYALPNQHKHETGAAVLRCGFDGETMRLLDIGGEIAVHDEVRGIGECSVIMCGGRYYLTIRGDTYGYVSVSSDGLGYTKPEIWRWEDGEIVPTYNTQSHWFTLGGSLWLVYTRKNGRNDHVFRHRAPLYAAKVNTGSLRLIRDSEFEVIPERGARLGNFGVCNVDAYRVLVTVTEWMQPAGCEKHGSNNALWLAEIRG